MFEHRNYVQTTYLGLTPSLRSLTCLTWPDAGRPSALGDLPGPRRWGCQAKVSHSGIKTHMLWQTVELWGFSLRIDEDFAMVLALSDTCELVMCSGISLILTFNLTHFIICFTLYLFDDQVGNEFEIYQNMILNDSSTHCYVNVFMLCNHIRLNAYVKQNCCI